jgi:hypothetical protein
MYYTKGILELGLRGFIRSAKVVMSPSKIYLNMLEGERNF